jgi:hypothetical protein
MATAAAASRRSARDGPTTPQKGQARASAHGHDTTKAANNTEKGAGHLIAPAWRWLRFRPRQQDRTVLCSWPHSAS